MVFAGNGLEYVYRTHHFYCTIQILDVQKHQKQSMKNKIKIQRAIHDLTQDDLAKIIGVSRQTINTMESGKYVPSTVLALKLAKELKITVEELFQLEKHD